MNTEEQLVAAELALHKLMTGAQVVSVDVDGHRVQYTPADYTDLQKYIRELEYELGLGTPRRPIQFVG